MIRTGGAAAAGAAGAGRRCPQPFAGGARDLGAFALDGGPCVRDARHERGGRMRRLLLGAFAVCAGLLATGPARAADLAARLGAAAADAGLRERVIAWRRDFHQHPELGNREFRTAARVAGHLRALGLAVETGVAKTGVVALIEGGRPGPRLALRADMDALPVTEELDLPFRSTVRTDYRGQQVGVMHACGHDAHTAILMGVAEVLARHRAELPGSVLLVFQPAEEGPPDGEEGGAPLMLKEGLFARHRPDAIVGLHVYSTLTVGQVGVRGGPTMAEASWFSIRVQGVQTHGARPWAGVDPITAAAHVITGLQSVVSRRTDIMESPAVVSVGAIRGGVRQNIIPDEVEIVGTIRSFDDESRERVWADVRRVAEQTAAAHGARAEVGFERKTNVNRNDPALTRRLRPALAAVVGEANTIEMPLQTVAEDFGYFAAEVPGFYYFVGSTPVDGDPRTAPANHSPRYFVDEAALDVGVRTMLQVAAEFLEPSSPR